HCGTPSAVAKKIVDDKDENLFCSLPASSRIYATTGCVGDCPIDIKQGRAYLRNINIDKSVIPKRTSPAKIIQKRIIKLRNIHFRYKKDEADVLRQLDFDIFRGESLCILGANGAGKSTLLKLLCSAYTPYIGKIKCEKGLKLSLLPQRAEMLFLKDTLIEDLTAFASELGLSKSDSAQRIEELSQLFNIKHLYNRHPYDLSGGETQRAALAKLMLNKPDVLLLDEPTKGIDPKTKTELSRLIKKLCSKNISVVTVTHDLEFAADTAERCALLFNGEIISCSAPREFFSGNSFYTTAANRISRGIIDGVISCEDIAEVFGTQEELQ
ncbi:MAG: energy-coupling factor ABC transporter ATP-binding protein, partial [Acutalibacteraceae bacterium]